MEEKLRKYLLKRHISEDVQKEFNIHLAKTPFNRLGIAIPVDGGDGSPVFNKYRRLPTEDNTDVPKYLYDIGSKASLFAGKNALGYIGPVTEVIVTEGELDALVLWSMGIPAVSSSGGCGTLREGWITMLLNKYERVILCFDSDEAGQKAMAKKAKLLNNPRVFVCILGVNIHNDTNTVEDNDTNPSKDITDFVSNGGDIRSFIYSNSFPSTLHSVLQTKDYISKTTWVDPVFFDEYLKEEVAHSRKGNGAIQANQSDRVSRAREYPIEQIVRVNGEHRFTCPWHNDKKPSMYLYQDNHAYCFACPKYADSIDLFMEINKCSFLEAVNRMQ